MELSQDDPTARALADAIRAGDAEIVQRLVDKQPALASVVIRDAKGGGRTPLHVVADWPGYFPNGPAIVAILVAHGAGPNVRIGGHGAETALHWAASSDDVAVARALIDAGADVNAPEGSIGTPLANAIGYGCWHTARLLVERGASTEGGLWILAALGMLAEVEAVCTADPPPSEEEINEAFWQACHGGQRRVAEYLLGLGADLNATQDYADGTPLDIARELDTGREQLAEWLVGLGARSSLH